MILDADSLATYLSPVHQVPIDISELHSDVKTLPKVDLAATFPPSTVLSAAVPWPGAFGSMIDQEFGNNHKSDDSGIFSGSSQGRSSLESLSSDIIDFQF